MPQFELRGKNNKVVARLSYSEIPHTVQEDRSEYLYTFKRMDTQLRITGTVVKLTSESDETFIQKMLLDISQKDQKAKLKVS